MTTAPPPPEPTIVPGTSVPVPVDPMPATEPVPEPAPETVPSPSTEPGPEPL